LDLRWPLCNCGEQVRPCAFRSVCNVNACSPRTFHSNLTPPLKHHSDMFTYGLRTFPKDPCAAVTCQYASFCVRKSQGGYECQCNDGLTKVGSQCVSSMKDSSSLRQSSSIAKALVAVAAEVRPPPANLLCMGLAVGLFFGFVPF
jgi:hypothetical protein